MRAAIQRLFSLSWKEGLLPDIWKTAEVKFLWKPGKSDYYFPNSYRPISLTSCLGEIMERIVMNMLESYIEGNGLMDAEQEGFRKKHSTVNAVLRLVQSILIGLKTRSVRQPSL